MADPDMIKTVCPQCGVVYDLEAGLIGQVGECAQCGSSFEIQDMTDYVNQTHASQQGAVNAGVAVEDGAENAVPPQQEAASESVPADEPVPESQDLSEDGTVAMSEASEPTATNTVRLTRMKNTGMLPQIENERFKVGTINASTQTVIGGGRRSFSSFQGKAVKKQKKWWQFWK